MKELRRSRHSGRGSFIVDRQGTILGFDEELEILTGWQALQVVGRQKDHCLGSGAGSPVALYAGDVPMIAGTRTLDLTLNCRDGRRLEVEAVTNRLTGPGERAQITILRVLASSASSVPPLAERRETLTGLPNRDAFFEQLTDDMVAASGTGRPLALILGDIDHLREINDRYGRPTGDMVLRKLAGILRVSVRDEQRIFRIADDDFAILLPNAGRGEARQVAAALRSTVERPRTFGGNDGEPDIQITMSLDAASFPTDAERESDLVERAQEALDEARSMGCNRVWCYLRRPRVPVHVPVFFDGAESLLVGYTRDLSPSGVFVQTAAPIDIGMRCALAFPLPGYEGKVHVIGRIVRTVPPETAPESPEVRVPGMGVEFERFGGTTDRTAIESFLHGRESTTLRPEIGPLSIPS
jgi:diguanylate cyclase (GGDEF)-like protein